MAKVRRLGEDLAVVFSPEEARALDLREGQELQACKARDNLFVCETAPANGSPIQEKPLEQRVIELLEATPFTERVEGRFEKMLSPESLQAFKQLLQKKEIVRFKLSPQYKKAIYKSMREIKNPPQKAQARPQPPKVDVSKKKLDQTHENIEDYSLEKNGFLVVKNEFRAKNLSFKLKPQIDSGAIKGIKSFEGVFYIMQSPVYEHLKEKMVPYLKEKKEVPLTELTEKFNLGKDLAKGVCEFLKEEGELSERRKEVFKYIDY